MIPLKDTIPRSTFPFVVLILITANALVFLFELSLPEPFRIKFIYMFGLVPARYTRPGIILSLSDYLPFVTDMFLHGGWLHLIGNMWFLFLFGDNVEDRMGHIPFFLFYLVAGITASVVHFYMNQNSTVPVIGASGAIAGIMGSYLRLFPRARIVTLIPILFFPFFFELPAVFFMGFWFFMQIFSGAISLVAESNQGGIAWWAHAGGFILGFLLIKPVCNRRFGICHPDEAYHYVYR